MAGGILLSHLRHGSVELFTAQDIVNLSFIVQNSISPLNLELSQASLLKDGFSGFHYEYITHRSKAMINTEEKCRKVLINNKHLFYTLHLDLPKEREWSLKRDDSKPRNLGKGTENLHIAEICIDEDFYNDILSHLINLACKRTDHKFKVLKWFIESNAFGEHVFDRQSRGLTAKYIDCMQPELEDSEFVTACFRKLDLVEWLYTRSSMMPGKVSNLLYQFHRHGRNLEGTQWIEDFLDLCLFRRWMHVGDVLKFKNTPNFRESRFHFLRQEVSGGWDSFSMKKITTTMSLRRCTLLLQVLWFCFDLKYAKLAEASEYLRLIWSSVPDTFLSYDEFAAGFKLGTYSAEIHQIYDFYSKAVGVLHPYVEPRSLKHYCRTGIRRILAENDHWLPDGIKETGLPRKLQSYLNLEG